MADGLVERAVKIERRMAEFYNRDRQAAAKLCDEVIDRSGNLLGWLRDAALNEGYGER